MSDFSGDILKHLEADNVQIVAFTVSYDEAISLFNLHSPDLLFIDVDLHGNNGGLAIAKKIKKQTDIPLIFIFNEYQRELAHKAFEFSSCGFIFKPITFEPLMLTIMQVIHSWKRQNRIKEIINTLPDIVYELDEKGSIRFISKNVINVFGYREDEFQTVMDVLKLFIPEDQKRAADNYLKTASGIPGKEVEYTIVDKNGNFVPISIIANPIIEDGVCKGTRGVIRDISERKKEQIKLFESEQKYRMLVENINDVHAILDLNGFISYVSPSVERLSGYLPEEITGKNFSEFVYSEDMPYVLEMFKRTLEGTRKPDEYRMVDKKGKVLWVRTSSSLIVKEGIKIGISSLLTDVTERRKLEEEIIHISEKERMRIGRDLHDGIGQYFTGLGYLFKTFINSIPRKTKKMIAVSEEIEKLISDAKIYTQMLARGYNPVTMSSNGFVATINDFCSGIEKLYHINCTFLHGDNICIADNEKAVHLFYIINEGVNNAIRHGKSKNILIMLARKSEKFELSIEDDGTGFEKGTKSSGLGLNIMCYRASIIGGAIKITDRNPTGTIVTCTFPIQ